MSDFTAGYVAAELARRSLESVHDLLVQACARHPHRTAFSCGPSQLTYAELEARADAFARYLRHHAGLQPGERLALQLGNSLQFVICVFGALKAGLVLVNTNPLYTAAEALHQFNDAGVRAIVLAEQLLPRLRTIQAQTAIEQVIVTSPDDMEAPCFTPIERGVERLMTAMRLGQALPPVTAAAGLHDLAMLQYTGGTTGVAKGAMLSHYNLLANAVQTEQLFGQPGLIDPLTDVRIAPLPLYHIMAFASNCLLSVLMGLHTVFIRDGRNLDEIVEAMRRHPFSLLNGINSLFVGLMNHPAFATLDFSRLKWATSGGAPLNLEVARRWEQLTGAPIREGYGLTETSPVVATSTRLCRFREGYCGQPLIDTRLRTVDEAGQDTPAGEPGELWVKGPQVMQGYWQRPQETAQVLDAEGWLKTGDIALLDEQGLLRIVDRKKDMILVSGFNVYPNEIEDVVMRLPGVRECVAVGVPHPRKGEDVRLYLSVKDPRLEAADVLRHCREFLTGYKVPASLVILEELPKSAVGKLLRRELRAQALREGEPS
ncbi:AMP-binding protein [Pseudomonas sp. NPDC089401]|uniref:AMP-binding protein n=1 Tax=Pseudomonas sp. NPDC089401 TaxID=3364462 RepID=UPI0037F44ACF